MAIYQKGQQKSVQLMVQLQHLGDLNQQMKCSLLGVMVLFDYFNGRVSTMLLAKLSHQINEKNASGHDSQNTLLYSRHISG